MGKVIFLDIDGTLVNFKGKMPESTIQALEKVKQNGHRIVLCTGRARCQIYPWLFEYDFDGIVGAAGAYVECNGTEVYDHHMQKETLDRIVDTLDEAGAVYALQARDCLIATEKNMEVMYQMMYDMGISERIAQSVIGVGKISQNMKQHRNIEKLIYYKSRENLAFMQSQLGDCCDITASSLQDIDQTDGEISTKGVNKAFGIQKYLDYLNIKHSDTIAIGDGPNDLDMLSFADVGIAMGNGSDALKEKADFITKDIDEDGILYAFTHFGLI